MSDKQQSKFRWKLNLLVGLLLVLVIFVAANGIAYKHYYRKNVLIASSYTKVGGQTINLLKGLTEPLTIVNYVTLGGDAVTPLIANDLDKLLDEYAYYGGKGKGKVSVRRLDPYLNLDEVRKLAEEYKLSTQENVLVISYKGQHRVLDYNDLANVDVSQVGAGGAARLVSLKAEDAISSAIQSLVQGQKTKIYFLTGHGEYDPDATGKDSAGYSVLRLYLERQNSVVSKLNLVEMPQVPEDADLLIIACPKSKYNPYELTVLQNYLQQGKGGKGGRLVLMLDPASDTGLENFAADYGVTFQNDLVMGKFATLGQTKVLPNAIASIYANHPAVEWLKRSGISVNLSLMRSIEVNNDTEKAKTAVITPLAKAPALFWGETDFKNPNIEFDPAKDFAGPLDLVVAIDTASIGGGQVQLKGMKMVLIGGGQFLINQVVGAEQIDFFINITNWMMEGGKPLGISPKVPKEFTVALSPQQMSSLLSILLLFPLAGVMVAFMVWFKRR